MKNTTTTIPAGIEWRNATAPTMIAAIVAPASGSGRGSDDQPERDRVRHAHDREHDRGERPAIRLISRLPVT
jgi:hypothetical protein